MITTRTFLSKCNTIMSNSPMNAGKNAVVEIGYGDNLYRALIYFDHSKIKNMVDGGEYPQISKLKHKLHMTNAGGVLPQFLNCREQKSYDPSKNRERAQSFNLIFFRLPYHWDQGRGTAHQRDLYVRDRDSYSTGGSNWYKCQDGFAWDDEGVYTTQFLSRQMDAYTSPGADTRANTIIGYQHFDNGGEDIELDITSLVNGYITGEYENFGIGIAMSPALEETTREVQQTVTFFSSETRSFYAPYVETTYDEYISDDRKSFHLNKDNNLCFYSIVGGRYENLDECPRCFIDDIEFPVHQVTKGVYSASVTLNSDDYSADSIAYDQWRGIQYNGKAMPDAELQFEVKSQEEWYTFGLPSRNVRNRDDVKPSPTVYGIHLHEKVPQGDKRRVNVLCRVPYSHQEAISDTTVQYRLYVHEGQRDYDVETWRPCDKDYTGPYFILDTESLMPARYHVDLRIDHNQEVTLHRGILEFDVAENGNNPEKY